MPGFDVKVEGLDQLKAKLDQLARPQAKIIANRALRAAGDVYKSEIEQRTPARPDLPSGTALPPGALQHDIQVKTFPAPDGGDSSYVAVGPGKHTERVMRWLEWGHDLVRNTSLPVGTRGRGRGRKNRGGQVVAHVPAHPVMRPSFEAAQSAATDAIAASLRKDLANVRNIRGGS